MSEEKKIRNKEELITLLLFFLEEGRKDIEAVIERYHARFYELGVDTAAVIGGEGQIISRFEMEKNLEEIMEIQVESSRNWMDKIGTAVSTAIVADAFTRDSFTRAVRKTLEGQAYHCRDFAMSGHRTAHLGLKDEMIEQDHLAEEVGKYRIEALFTAFPEAEVIETSCSGCPPAVAGNPYTPEDVPSPGDFECAFNCRHEIHYRKVLIAGGEE